MLNVVKITTIHKIKTVISDNGCQRSTKSSLGSRALTSARAEVDNPTLRVLYSHRRSVTAGTSCARGSRRCNYRHYKYESEHSGTEQEITATLRVGKCSGWGTRALSQDDLDALINSAAQLFTQERGIAPQDAIILQLRLLSSYS